MLHEQVIGKTSLYKFDIYLVPKQNI
jgi:hypothetical protein